jgi:hypothetical protein
MLSRSKGTLEGARGDAQYFGTMATVGAEAKSSYLRAKMRAARYDFSAVVRTCGLCCEVVGRVVILCVDAAAWAVDGQADGLDLYG